MIIKNVNNPFILDCEVYPNYFLISFLDTSNNKVFNFELKNNECFSDKNIPKIKSIMNNNLTVGFNSSRYDLLVIYLSLLGKKPKDIYELSSDIINNNLQPYILKRKYNINIPSNIKHIDVKDVSPAVNISLKMHCARLHLPKLQSLPIPSGSILSVNDMDVILKYCKNDLDLTYGLFNELKDRLFLRLDLSKEYNLNLTSSSDAQICEKVFKSEIFNIDNSFEHNNNEVKVKVRYKAPRNISFKTKQLKDLKKSLEESYFYLDNRGSLEIPSKLSNLKINIGKSVYRIGIGGLHTCEKSISYYSNSKYNIIDSDVSSYYPSIILNNNFTPNHLTDLFIPIYDKLVKRRLKAKKEKLLNISNSLKIIINGAYGKLGSKWSILYSPETLLNVTLTGQLSLLMLIEKLTINNINVISCNTDGITTYIKRIDIPLYENICNEWSESLNYVLDNQYYKSIHYKDVNNYIAIYDNGNHKCKGVYSNSSIIKNPNCDIVNNCIIEYIKKGVSPDISIKNSTSIKDFIVSRNINNTGLYNKVNIGKIARWFFSKNGKSIFTTSKTSKGLVKVPNTENSKLIMDIIDYNYIPKDINYETYLTLIKKGLFNLGIKSYTYYNSDNLFFEG